ncbi:MAG TPA: M48 family metalloprotease [Pyrinomonadaceae bacterium]|jgi:predicted Zn-dependent protease|nr:M48 family metalloprotease [Pyrinomonadaceae bacterium]
MKSLRKIRLLAATLCFCIAFTSFAPVALSQKKKAPVEATAPPVREEFKFGKVDLDLLEQVNLLDRRFERDGLVLEDEAANAYLFRVGESLIPKGLTLENITWKFRALRDPQPNAFALPNGSIYVTTGLMSLMDNESELAAVIAHELTHVMRRHTYLQNRSNRKKFLTMNVMAAVGAYAPGGIVGAVISVVTAIAPFIIIATIFGYSRDLEREADLKGIDMMISAEYPPEEMVNVMKLLDKDIEGENVRLFYNDHPALRERISYLSSYLGARADRVTPQMELNRERAAYFRQMESVMRHDIQLSINGSRFRSAVYLAQRLVDFHPDSENLYWLAESYRTLGPRAPQLTERELTNSAKKDAAKKREKRTVEEEERDLLATPAGQENWKQHAQKAEELYVRALSFGNPVPVAHRGQGMLYEKLDRKTDAVSEYEKYVELAPNAIDRERIQKRIESLRRPPQ